MNGHQTYQPTTATTLDETANIFFSFSIVPMQSSYSIIQLNNRRSLHPWRSIYANAMLWEKKYCGSESEPSDIDINDFTSTENAFETISVQQRMTQTNFLITAFGFCAVFAATFFLRCCGDFEWSRRIYVQQERRKKNMTQMKDVFTCVSACFGHFCNISFFAVGDWNESERNNVNCLTCRGCVCVARKAVNMPQRFVHTM